MAKETALRQDKKFVAGPLKDNSMCIETNPRFHKVQISQFVCFCLSVCLFVFLDGKRLTSYTERSP